MKLYTMTNATAYILSSRPWYVVVVIDKCLGFIELDCTLFETAVQFNREVNLTYVCPFLDLLIDTTVLWFGVCRHTLIGDWRVALGFLLVPFFNSYVQPNLLGIVWGLN